MKVFIEHDVTCCNNCPYISNPDAHNDPFTSEPYSVGYDHKTCTHRNGPRYIADYRVIDERCPIQTCESKLAEIARLDAELGLDDL